MMTGPTKRFVLAAAFAGLLSFSACANAQAPRNPVGPTDPLTIVSGDKTHAFNVELADTPEETERGLMFRESMPKDHGMIFEFDPPYVVSMWMKNCLFPQDMLFLNTDGSIIAIAENARPGSERLISAGVPVASVLELNGGVAKELGLKVGDKVQHKLFDNADGG